MRVADPVCYALHILRIMVINSGLDGPTKKQAVKKQMHCHRSVRFASTHKHKHGTICTFAGRETGHAGCTAADLLVRPCTVDAGRQDQGE